MIGSVRSWSLNPGQSAVAVIVTLLLLSATVPVVSGAQPVSSTSSEARASVDTTPIRAQQTTANNSSAVRHQNPNNESEEGDLDAISNQLSRSLAGRLGQSSISISREQYELAREYVGEEYRNEAARYVEIAEATSNESDDRVAERFNQTATNQQQFADRLAEFNETRERYREARQAGNESGARELARQLRRTADDLQRTQGDLVRNYDRISDGTSADLSEETELLNETVAQRIAEAEEIQDTEFEPTSITVETTTVSPDVSFVNPAQLEGRLTASGEPLGDRDIELEIGTQRIETETDGDGRFTADYRPVTVPLGTQQLDVTYVPRNESDYQRSNDSVRVDVSQVSPDVTVSPRTAEGRFDDTITVSAAVSVDDVPVRTAPVSVFLAGERITANETTRETDETGRSERDVEIPLDLAAGDQQIRVVVGNETNAIGRAEALTTVTVLPTNASLGVVTRRVNESVGSAQRREVVTQGRLTTENGTAIGGQPIEISVEGVAITTVRTDQVGWFNTTIEVPARFLPSSVGGEEAIQITATYANEETSIADTTSTSSVLFQAELLNVVGQNLSWSRTLAAFLVLGSAVALRRRYDNARIEEVPDTAGDSPRDGSGATAEETSEGISLLELADRWLEAGRTRAAVEFAYAAARDRFVETYDVSPDATHWEFYRRCRAVSGEDLDDFERLTTLYERAAFSEHPIEDATAGEAYLLAEEVCDDLDAETAAGVETRAVTDSSSQASQGPQQTEPGDQ